MNKKMLIVGIVLGLIAVVLTNIRISQVESSQKRLAYLSLNANSAASAGDSLTGSMFRTVYLPEEFSSMNAVALQDSPQSREWVKQQTVNRDLEPGAILLFEYFSETSDRRFATKIGPQNRAMTITVNAMSSVGYFIEPGSRVDVLGTLEEQRTVTSSTGASLPSSQIVTKTILQNVAVLAVGRATTRGNYVREIERGYGTVTLEVTPVQAELLIFAMQQVEGGLTLTLRNPEDSTISDIPSVGWDAID